MICFSDCMKKIPGVRIWWQGMEDSSNLRAASRRTFKCRLLHEVSRRNAQYMPSSLIIQTPSGICWMHALLSKSSGISSAC